MSTRERQPRKPPVPRAKSVSSQPPHPQTRTRKIAPPLSTSSAVYKTNSDTSLANGVRRINLSNDRKGISDGKNLPVRRRLGSGRGGFKNMEDLAEYILNKRAKNIVVMAGAGISTSSGIPDFRTPGTGLYDNLKQYKIPYPEAIFDIDYFEVFPKPFYTLAKEIYPNGTYKPNFIHYFLRLLHDKGLLLRVYTQNIDGLERLAGVPDAKLVEAHGNFMTASCVRCKHKHCTEQTQNAICEGKFPRCMKNRCSGLVKPDIVFFGEDLPRRFYYYLKDFPQADLLLVMGTSLEVEPFAGIVDSVRLYVPRVLFNRQAVGPFEKKRRMNDIVAQGDIIQQLKLLVNLLGWDKDMESLLPQLDLKEPSCTENDNSGTTVSTEGTSASDEATPSVTSTCSSTMSQSSKTSSHSPTTTPQKPSNNSDPGLLSKRYMLPTYKPMPPRNERIRNNTDISTVNRMVRANIRNETNHKSIFSGIPSIKSGNDRKTLFPNIRRNKPIAFHAQRSLYRTNNPSLLPPSDPSSEDSSDDTDDDA